MTIKKILFSVALTIILGSASGLFTISEIPGWYARLNKPSWNPPNWLFGPVWTFLYLLMGIALGLVWSSNHEKKELAIRLFVVQFLLNLFWTIIFFNLHLIGTAAIEVWILFLFILLTLVNFYRINKWAGILLIPYLLWVCFASVLNGTIWQMNHYPEPVQ